MNAQRRFGPPPRGVGCLNNRSYASDTGVFASVDPLVGDTKQPYLYGNANPVVFSDPEGLDPDTSSRVRSQVERQGGCTYSSGYDCYEKQYVTGNHTKARGNQRRVAQQRYSEASAGYGPAPTQPSTSDSNGDARGIVTPVAVAAPSGGGGEPLWRKALNVTRFTLNLPLTVPAVAYSEAVGGDCEVAEGLVPICADLPAWANGPADSVTVGAVMSELSVVTGDHLAHETAHYTQSAVLGPLYLPGYLFGAAVTAPVDIVRGCTLGTSNPLEVLAGSGGGYGC